MISQTPSFLVGESHALELVPVAAVPCQNSRAREIGRGAEPCRIEPRKGGYIVVDAMGSHGEARFAAMSDDTEGGTARFRIESSSIGIDV